MDSPEAFSAGTDSAGPDPAVCSARGCRKPALWALNWRNPKIHEAARVKTWLACEQHRESLAAFLSARGFPLDVVPFTS